MRLRDVVKAFISSLIMDGESFKEIAIGFHNAMAHGTVFIEKDINFEESDLIDLLTSLEDLVAIGENISDMN